MAESPVSLHPSKDPRHSMVAFGRLVASLAEPFSDRAAILDAVGLHETDVAALEAKWAERMRADPNAVTIFEQSFRSATGALARRDIAEDSTDDARFLSPRQPFREEAAQVRASAPGDDPQTLPISGPIAIDALPFQPGEFRPLPSLPRSGERRRDPVAPDAFDPDVTRPPQPKDGETLPFHSGAADSSKRPKRA
jgi:hypothetical protein